MYVDITIPTGRQFLQEMEQIMFRIWVKPALVLYTEAARLCEEHGYFLQIQTKLVSLLGG